MIEKREPAFATVLDLEGRVKTLDFGEVDLYKKPSVYWA
jgi:hypothetical protein